MLRKELTDRLIETRNEIGRLELYAEELETALRSLKGRPQAHSDQRAGTILPTVQPRSFIPTDDAIIAAINSGRTKPANITPFVNDLIQKPIDKANIRTRLSRMKKAGRVTNDGQDGWKVI